MTDPIDVVDVGSVVDVEWDVGVVNVADVGSDVDAVEIERDLGVVNVVWVVDFESFVDVGIVVDI